MRCTPAPASSSPATAGPTIAPVWNSDWKIALEAGSSSMPTRPGSIAFRAELSMPDSAAVTAGNRNSGHSAGPRSALSASAGAAQRADRLDDDQDLAPVHRVDQRPAEQRPEDQREQLRERHQPDDERRPGDRVHLERDRDRGELVAEHRDPEPGDQRPVVARPPQRREVEKDVPGRASVDARALIGDSSDQASRPG